MEDNELFLQCDWMKIKMSDLHGQLVNKLLVDQQNIPDLFNLVKEEFMTNQN
jgi:hypothetical protein